MGKKKNQGTSIEQPEDSILEIPTRIERMRRAFTVAELAEITSISGKQIYSLIRRRAIPHYRIASSIRFDPKKTADWLRSQDA
jgi:excisionase family DNA binding protein